MDSSKPNKSKNRARRKNRKAKKAADKLSSIIGSTGGIYGTSSLTHQNPFLYEEVLKVCNDLHSGMCISLNYRKTRSRPDQYLRW